MASSARPTSPARTTSHDAQAAGLLRLLSSGSPSQRPQLVRGVGATALPQMQGTLDPRLDAMLSGQTPVPTLPHPQPVPAMMSFIPSQIMFAANGQAFMAMPTANGGYMLMPLQAAPQPQMETQSHVQIQQPQQPVQQMNLNKRSFDDEPDSDDDATPRPITKSSASSSEETDGEVSSSCEKRSSVSLSLASSRAPPKKRRRRNKSPDCPCSDFRGVSWHRRDQKWLARTWINGRIEHLGCYRAEEMAALAVDLRTIEHFGPNTKKELNFSDPEERRKLREHFEALGEFKVKTASELNGSGNYHVDRRLNGVIADTGVVGNGFALQMRAQQPQPVFAAPQPSMMGPLPFFMLPSR